MKRRFDSKGVIAIIAAIALPVVLLLASGSMDMGRAYIVKQRLQTAVDAAALVAQVNAANATPETACQSTDAMNAALLANITSNGFLSTSTPTLISCNYDSTAKKIAVTGTVTLNKTLGFAPSSVTATGYASLDNDTGSSPWMYQFKTQNSDCKDNGYLSILSLTSTNNTLVMSGPVQNNCRSTDWSNTKSIVYGGDGTTKINYFYVSGSVIMNGTPGATFCNYDGQVENIYYLCPMNGTNMQGTIVDNIPIATNQLNITTGTTLSSTLSSPEILRIIGGKITGDTSSAVTINNMKIDSTTSPFTIGQNYTLNLYNNTTFMGPIITQTGSTINIYSKSNITINNSGNSINNTTINIDNSSWVNTSICQWCYITNSTINLNQSTMISGAQTNIIATLTNNSKVSFLSGIPATGTYNLSDGSVLDISQLASWSNSLTVRVGDTSKIISSGSIYTGPGVSGQSYTFQCIGSSTCTRQ